MNKINLSKILPLAVAITAQVAGASASSPPPLDAVVAPDRPDLKGIQTTRRQMRLILRNDAVKKALVQEGDTNIINLTPAKAPNSTTVYLSGIYEINTERCSARVELTGVDTATVVSQKCIPQDKYYNRMSYDESRRLLLAILDSSEFLHRMDYRAYRRSGHDGPLNTFYLQCRDGGSNGGLFVVGFNLEPGGASHFFPQALGGAYFVEVNGERSRSLVKWTEIWKWGPGGGASVGNR